MERVTLCTRIVMTTILSLTHDYVNITLLVKRKIFFNIDVQQINFNNIIAIIRITITFQHKQSIRGQ